MKYFDGGGGGGEGGLGVGREGAIALLAIAAWWLLQNFV